VLNKTIGDRAVTGINEAMACDCLILFFRINVSILVITQPWLLRGRRLPVRSSSINVDLNSFHFSFYPVVCLEIVLGSVGERFQSLFIRQTRCQNKAKGSLCFPTFWANGSSADMVFNGFQSVWTGVLP